MFLCHDLDSELSTGGVVGAHAYGSEGTLAKFTAEGITFLNFFNAHEFEFLKIVDIQSAFLSDSILLQCGLFL